MKTKFHRLLFALALLAGVQSAAAQGTTAFTYQGQLHDTGTNANGTYGMIFKLYDAGSGGTLEAVFQGTSFSINDLLSHSALVVSH